jgi:hypothetical protein
VRWPSRWQGVAGGIDARSARSLPPAPAWLRYQLLGEARDLPCVGPLNPRLARPRLKIAPRVLTFGRDRVRLTPRVPTFGWDRVKLAPRVPTFGRDRVKLAPRVPTFGRDRVKLTPRVPSLSRDRARLTLWERRQGSSRAGLGARLSSFRRAFVKQGRPHLSLALALPRPACRQLSDAPADSSFAPARASLGSKAPSFGSPVLSLGL